MTCVPGRVVENRKIPSNRCVRGRRGRRTMCACPRSARRRHARRPLWAACDGVPGDTERVCRVRRGQPVRSAVLPVVRSLPVEFRRAGRGARGRPARGEPGRAGRPADRESDRAGRSADHVHGSADRVHDRVGRSADRDHAGAGARAPDAGGPGAPRPGAPGRGCPRTGGGWRSRGGTPRARPRWWWRTATSCSRPPAAEASSCGSGTPRRSSRGTASRSSGRRPGCR